MNESKQIPFGRPWITDQEREAVLEVLNGPILTHGAKCKEFESLFSEFVGDDAIGVSLSSCMAALHLSAINLRIKPGDEVLVPALTHVATVHAVEWMGAKPVFVDCELKTGNIDCSDLEQSVNEHTRAIFIVHFLGIPCAMDCLVEITKKHNLDLVEDCALAVGSRFGGKHVGLFGTSGCFSFYPVKHITTGEGGMCITANKEFAEAIRLTRAFGVDRSHTERTTPGQYDVKALGLNYRMSELQAALGCVQMKKLAQIIEIRERNFRFLKEVLSSNQHISIIDSQDNQAQPSYYCFSFVLGENLRSKRNEIVKQLNRNGVGTSIYYPQPVPRMKYYQEKYGYQKKQFPNAEAISDGSIALPIGPHVSASDIEWIGQKVLQVLEKI